jgi:hypothetical protein
MGIDNQKAIHSHLSKLLKKSLATSELKLIAEKFDVHYNTIINIRDRRKKSPNERIVKHMIKMSISSLRKSIKENMETIVLLEQELEKFK